MKSATAPSPPPARSSTPSSPWSATSTSLLSRRLYYALPAARASAAPHPPNQRIFDRMHKMAKRLDIAGQRFGERLVISFSHVANGNSHWTVKCDCGNTEFVPVTSLKTSISCFACGVKRRAQKRTRHGESMQTKEYLAWWNMIARCKYESTQAWPWYGGRGIKVCERWEKYENFLADVGRAPSPSHSIDRIDSDGNYEPGNVRWATWGEQRFNQRRQSSRSDPVN